MIRDRLRRWVHEASTALEEEQDSSQVQVYTAPWIVPGSAAPIRDGAVAFSRHGQVLACGPREDVVEAFSWARRADLDGILLPGLINAHAHLELSGAREDIKDGIGLSRWLRKLRDLRTETEALDPHSREAHIRGGVRRSVDSGTAAVGEVSDTLRAVPAMAREGLYGAVFHEILGFSARRAAKALAAAAVEKAGIVPWPEGIRYLLAPHSPYSTSGAVIHELCTRALDKGAVTTIRLAEHEQEWDLIQTGKEAARTLVEAVESCWDEFRPHEGDPLAYMEDLGALNNRVMLVHMTTATRDMAARASRAGAPLVLCPRTNRKVAGRVPPLVSFLEEGCRVAIGTGTSTAAPDLSVLREAAELRAAYPEVPALSLVHAATAGGADALNLPGLGSLEPGRSPGLLHTSTGATTPNDPCGWLLDAGTPDFNWLERAAPPQIQSA